MYKCVYAIYLYILKALFGKKTFKMCNNNNT